MDDEIVFTRMQDAITNTKVSMPTKPEKSEYHKAQLVKAKEARKNSYRRMKEFKKRNDGR